MGRPLNLKPSEKADHVRSIKQNLEMGDVEFLAVSTPYTLERGGYKPG